MEASDSGTPAVVSRFPPIKAKLGSSCLTKTDGIPLPPHHHKTLKFISPRMDQISVTHGHGGPGKI